MKRDNLARQHCSKNITKFAKKRPWENILAKKQSPVGKQSFVYFSQSVRVCFANQDEVCTILVTWNCQFCYIYLSKSLHVFVKYLHVFLAHCQTKPSWSLTKISRFVDFADSDIELNWLCLLNSQLATCSKILYSYPKYWGNCPMMKQKFEQCLLNEVRHSNELKKTQCL